MPKQLIANRLKNAMGLHTPTVGMITISSAIDRRMRALQLENCAQYLGSLDNDPGEMQNLIEAVIIPETWFFRDAIAYKKLLEYLRTRQSAENRAQLKILSIPCSTGEEPYSIAMLLADNGFEDGTYKIDAVDISEKLIQKAIFGLYGKHSFRAEDLSFVNRHFTRCDDNFRLSDTIKARVNFHHANLLDADFLPGYAIYDVIFCRNLLIYFDGPTQARVFSVLARLLKNDGILILGHAETSQRSAGLFEPATTLGPYINRKASKAPAISRGSGEADPVSNKHTTIADKEVPAKLPEADLDSPLEKAFALANEGHIKEAIELGLACVQHDRFSSRAHYLLGLLYDISADTSKADDYLKKALYLDPNNIEALIHLSLMAEQRGDSGDSERLRNRAERVQNRNKLS